MEWDADSNRVSFTSSTGGTTQFVYDITAGIPAVIKETGSQYDKTYVREPDGSLIAMFVGSYPYYYHFDALGSTRMLTDESGHITDSYTYDAWGNLLTHYPNSISQPYQYVGQLGYYTHYQDANLPLLQLGVRFYDPGVGRFGQVDLIRKRGRSAYVYSSDLPTAKSDPLGLEDSRGGKRPPIFFEPDKNCNICQPYLAQSIAGGVTRYASEVMDEYGLKCPKTITIKCKPCDKGTGPSGSSRPHSHYINLKCTDPPQKGAWPLYCVILHELTHACGRTGHPKDLTDYETPGCGNLLEPPYEKEE